VYTGDPTILNLNTLNAGANPKSAKNGVVKTSVVTPNTAAADFASTNPQFIPAPACNAAAVAAETAEERKTFSVQRMFKRAFSTTMNILSVFLLIALGVFGSSLATNLNVYHGWPYRLLYAIYGFVFFFVVIPYTLLWRWAYLKKRPRFYALIPLIDTPIDNPMLANLLSWFTFEPDDEMAYLDGCRA